MKTTFRTLLRIPHINLGCHWYTWFIHGDEITFEDVETCGRRTWHLDEELELKEMKDSISVVIGKMVTGSSYGMSVSIMRPVTEKDCVLAQISMVQ